MIALWWLLAGCPPAPTDDTAPLDSEVPWTDDTAPSDCAPLVASMEPAEVGTLRRGQVRVQGGSGQVAFRFVEDRSGGELSEATGDYLAGPTPAEDVIEVTDAACGSTATVTVPVHPALEVRPEQARVLRGDRVVLEVIGGSPDVACSVARDDSAGTLQGCAWTVGPHLGFDVVRVSDARLALEVDVVLDVVEEMPVASDAWAVVAVGEPLVLSAVGASGRYTYEVIEGDLEIADGVVATGAPAGGTVRVADRWSPSAATDVRVRVVAPLAPAPEIDGQATARHRAVGADLDGDGWSEAIFGLQDSAGAMHRSGVVAIYRGTAAGFEAVPVQVIEGTLRNGTLGYSLAVGDLDGDGLPDLALGAPDAESARGRVEVYRNTEAGLFEPWATLRGLSGDRLGSEVATCDLDGDGTHELITSSRTAPDRSVSPNRATVGALAAWRVSGGADASTPLWTRVGGEVDAEGAFSVVAGTQIGTSLAVGDVDGDGLCDVVAASTPRAQAQLYRGLGEPPWLEAEPSRTWQGPEAAADEFGWSLALGDLDDDGADEVLVGCRRSDYAAFSNPGQVYGFSGGAGQGDVVLAAQAAFVIGGERNNHEIGTSLHVADFTGDATLDLVVGSARYVATSEVGALLWFDGDALAAGGRRKPSDGGVVLGVGTGGWFGLAGLPARRGADLHWVASAGRADAHGPDVGTVEWIQPDGARADLAFPVVPTGAEVGRRGALAVFDVDDDGIDDLLVGAPLDGHATYGRDTGQMVWYRGDGAGFAAEPSPWAFGSGGPGPHAAPPLREGAEFGTGIAPVGDFDGDGRADLAVLAGRDFRPATLSSAGIASPSTCGAALAAAGSIAVYRGGAPLGAPDFVVYGEASNGLDRVASADLDGDGRRDLVIGSRLSNAVGVVRGRDAIDGTLGICTSERFTSGEEDRLGWNVAGVDDLDGDGCDEMWVGAPIANSGLSANGRVHLVYGWGPACARPTPHRVTFQGPVNNAGTGYGLAAGDLDGDGVAELIVGSPGGLGRVHVIRRDDLPAPVEVVGGKLDGAGGVALPGLVLPGIEGGDLGREVAIGGDGLLVLGAPFSDTPEAVDAGAVYLARYDGLEVALVGRVRGAASDAANLGYGLFADARWLLVGAPWSGLVVPETGAVLPVRLAP